MQASSKKNLAAFVVLTLCAVALVTVAQDPGGLKPTITAPDVAPPGSVLIGNASAADGGLVTVTAKIDGEEVPGSPDDVMNGDTNFFELQIPEDAHGKKLVIVAEDMQGNKATKIVDIV